MSPRPVPLAFFALALLIVALWGLNFPVPMAAGSVTPTAWAFVPLVLNGQTHPWTFHVVSASAGLLSVPAGVSGPPN